MYLQDIVLLLAGLILIFKEAGIFLPPPEHISIEILLMGGLLCNGPLFLQVLTVVRTFWRPELPEQPEPDSSPVSLSKSSRGDP